MTVTARSASDRTDDWPFWYVADERGLNITQQLTGLPRFAGAFSLQPFLLRHQAEALAQSVNEGRWG